ncbi:MAG: hypothetical protein AAB795_03610 [Patescibacteria group bacterium]|mgnify:CR=1 FL=1
MNSKQKKYAKFLLGVFFAFTINTPYANASNLALCVGDCNEDCSVTVDELIIGVNIALGIKPMERCWANRNEKTVTIDELIIAVNNALNGCGNECVCPVNTFTSTLTPTNMPTSTPTWTSTSTRTLTLTLVPTFTATQTNTPTETATRTHTSTQTPTRTATSMATFSNTPTQTVTRTDTPTTTSTDTPTPLVQGCLWAVAVGPYGIGQSDQDILSEEQVHHYVDLALPYTKGIRFFGTRGGLQYGPPYAKQIGLNPVISGVFVNNDSATVADQLLGLHDVARDSNYVVVGNKAVGEQGVAMDQLLDYACQAKEIVLAENSNAMVTIGEGWDVYLAHQTQIKNTVTSNGYPCIDVVFGYRQPFYDADRPNVESMVDRVVEAYQNLDGAYDISVYIGETGMPGAPDKDIASQSLDPRATLENQKLFWQLVLNNPVLREKIVGYQVNDEEWLCGFEAHLCKFGFYYSNLSTKWQVAETFSGDCTIPLPTPTFTFTATSTPTATATRTFTITPTNSSTRTSTPTKTLASTFTATRTSTQTSTATAVFTGTQTRTSTASSTLTFTATPTRTAINTSTAISTPTKTSTMMPTSILIFTPTSSPTATMLAQKYYEIVDIGFDGRAQDETSVCVDMQAIADTGFKTVRWYGMRFGGEYAGCCAKKAGLKTYAGLHFYGAGVKDDWESNNQFEIDAFVAGKDQQIFINDEPVDCIDNFIVGNNGIKYNFLTPLQLVGFINQIRALTDKPVSTAEPEDIWLAHAETLCLEVDFVWLNALTFFDSSMPDPTNAAQQAIDSYMNVKMTCMAINQNFAEENFFIGEFGWPTSKNGGADSRATLAQAKSAHCSFLHHPDTPISRSALYGAYDEPGLSFNLFLPYFGWFYDVSRDVKFSNFMCP